MDTFEEQLRRLLEEDVAKVEPEDDRAESEGGKAQEVNAAADPAAKRENDVDDDDLLADLRTAELLAEEISRGTDLGAEARPAIGPDSQHGAGAGNATAGDSASPDDVAAGLVDTLFDDLQVLDAEGGGGEDENIDPLGDTAAAEVEFAPAPTPGAEATAVDDSAFLRDTLFDDLEAIEDDGAEEVSAAAEVSGAADDALSRSLLEELEVMAAETDSDGFGPAPAAAALSDSLFDDLEVGADEGTAAVVADVAPPVSDIEEELQPESELPSGEPAAGELAWGTEAEAPTAVDEVADGREPGKTTPPRDPEGDAAAGLTLEMEGAATDEMEASASDGAAAVAAKPGRIELEMEEIDEADDTAEVGESDRPEPEESAVADLEGDTGESTLGLDPQALSQRLLPVIQERLLGEMMALLRERLPVILKEAITKELESNAKH